jgi:hypothetical protein
MSDFKIDKETKEDLEISEQNTEQALIEMAEHYKQIYSKLTNEVSDLKKTLMMCFTLFRLESLDWEVCEMGRELCEDQLDKYFFDN